MWYRKFSIPSLRRTRGNLFSMKSTNVSLNWPRILTVSVSLRNLSRSTSQVHPVSLKMTCNWKRRIPWLFSSRFKRASSTSSKTRTAIMLSLRSSRYIFDQKLTCLYRLGISPSADRSSPPSNRRSAHSATRSFPRTLSSFAWSMQMKRWETNSSTRSAPLRS